MPKIRSFGGGEAVGGGGASISDLCSYLVDQMNYLLT
jgi:hypothetical protein